MQESLQSMLSQPRQLMLALIAACALSPIAASANQWGASDDVAFFNPTQNAWNYRSAGTIYHSIKSGMDKRCDQLPYPPSDTGKFCRAEQVGVINLGEGNNLPAYRVYQSIQGDAKIVFYEDENFTGLPFIITVSKPFNISDLSKYPYPNATAVAGSWNDRFSSVSVPIGVKLTLFEHANYGGAPVNVEGNEASLGRRNFNDMASSFQMTFPGNK